MNHRVKLSFLCAALIAAATWQASAQQGAQNPFPLAPRAGQDSKAKDVAPQGAVNQGAFDASKWKYGPAFNAPAGTKLWNPAKIKLMGGGKIVGGTVVGVTDPQVYCAMASGGYDFTWTEMQHSPSVWDAAVRAWQTCPHAKAVPGVRIAYTDEQEIQHALDSGALVLVVPTVDTAEEAREVVKWALFPPMGSRSQGGGPAFDPAMWGNVPGGYRQTINDNLIIIVMLETLEALKNAEAIAAVPGITAVFAASGDLVTSPATSRAIPTTSAPSISSMTRRSRRARSYAVRSRGRTAPISRASRPAMSAQRLRAVCAKSWASSPTRKARPKSAPSRRRSREIAPDNESGSRGHLGADQARAYQQARAGVDLSPHADSPPDSLDQRPLHRHPVDERIADLQRTSASLLGQHRQRR